jgi:hypothetical protein
MHFLSKNLDFFLNHESKKGTIGSKREEGKENEEVDIIKVVCKYENVKMKPIILYN